MAEQISAFLGDTLSSARPSRGGPDFTVLQALEEAGRRAEKELGDYPAVQYVPPEGGFHIDILTRLGEVYSFEGLVSERLDFDGLEVTVVTPRTLYEMKKGTVRPGDWGDAERLRRRFDFGE